MITEDFVVTAPKLEPFTDLDMLSCEVCGTTSVKGFARLWVIAHARSLSIFSVSYCSGGRPPVEDISNPIEAMMRGNSEIRPRCGGIAEPHLHLKCNCCDHIRLMRTKS